MKRKRCHLKFRINKKKWQQIPLTEYELDGMVDNAQTLLATNVIDILMNLNQIE